MSGILLLQENTAAVPAAGLSPHVQQTCRQQEVLCTQPVSLCSQIGAQFVTAADLAMLTAGVDACLFVCRNSVQDCCTPVAID